MNERAGIARDEPDPSEEANARFWASAPLVADYDSRGLRPVEVILMVRYREDLAGRVLEAGCGAGRVVGYLAATAADAHGVDVSQQMVDYCRATYPQGTFEVADVRDVAKLAAAPFDAILAPFNLLDALGAADRNRTLSAMHEAIAPGGLLIMSAHNRAFAPEVVGPIATFAGHLRRRDIRWMLRNLPRLPRQVRNRRRIAPLEINRPGYAVLNDEAHDFALLMYYVSRDEQERQLAERGFEVLEVLDLEGRTLPAGEQAEGCSELHYVARRLA